MAYGELGKSALKWATKFVFGIDSDLMPSMVVITPLRIEECFKNFQAIINSKGLELEKAGSGFLVWVEDEKVLFCEGGIGASNFADSSYILCHCKNVKEIVFVGTGGGIGEHVRTVDINIPSSCVRLDKVLEILLPPDALARADPKLVESLKIAIEKEVHNLGIKVHVGKHATVPFFLSETKELLIALQKQGVLSVDMELSVLYALANHYDKKAAGIIRIGDLPLRGLPAWKSSSHKLRIKQEVHRKILKGIMSYLAD
jgi:purine-nucleoside phosphorylase